jgi:hypothetical protein
MHDADLPVTSRNFSRVDARRAFSFLGTLVFVGAGYWFILPALQSQIIPNAPGGAAGPWVVRPILAFHAGAAAVLACLTVPLILGPVQKQWKREDAALSTRYDPFRGQPAARAAIMIKGGLLFLIYGCAFAFYLFSWTIIGPDGVEERLPWGKRKHAFQDINSLEAIPDGQRSDSIAQNGPWYSLTFQRGGSITLSHDNEGTTPAELTAMTSHIAKRSGLVWRRRADVRPR